jgi:hypothetical protein
MASAAAKAIAGSTGAAALGAVKKTLPRKT